MTIWRWNVNTKCKVSRCERRTEWGWWRVCMEDPLFACCSLSGQLLILLQEGEDERGKVRRTTPENLFLLLLFPIVREVTWLFSSLLKWSLRQHIQREEWTEETSLSDIGTQSNSELSFFFLLSHLTSLLTSIRRQVKVFGWPQTLSAPPVYFHTSCQSSLTVRYYFFCSSKVLILYCRSFLLSFRRELKSSSKMRDWKRRRNDWG